MGVTFTKYLHYFWFNSKQYRIIMIGLDNAGKTQILYKLKLGDTITTIPTVGFNVETVSYKWVNLVVWDIGGQDKLRTLWRHYYEGLNGLIFVIDASDRERIREAIESLSTELVQPQMQKAPILILANKQDIEGAISAEELTDVLHTLFKGHDRNFKVFETVATKDIGIIQGIDWLFNELVKSFS